MSRPAAPTAARTPRGQNHLLGYALAILLVIGAHGMITLTWHALGDSALFAVCVAAVAVAALFGGAGPGMLATVLLAIDLDYAFMPPYHSLRLDFQSLLQLMAFCTIAIIISYLQGHRHKAEESVRAARDQLEARVAERTAEMLTLQREILDISERERIRIGHDLHDGLGQELSGTAMMCIALAQRLTEVASAPSSSSSGPAPAGSAAADAEQIADLIHESIRHTRELARGLCPLDMDEEGLPAAIRQLADRVARLPGVRCECQLPTRASVDSAAAVHLHRIAQEAINNAVRHGKANLVSIQLFEEAGRLTLIVADDGVGIPDPVPPGNGLGLRLMCYRAKMIGGSVQVGRNSPHGTVVTCRVSGQAQQQPRENGHV